MTTGMDSVHYFPTASSTAQMPVNLFCCNQLQLRHQKIAPFVAVISYCRLMIVDFVENIADNKQIIPCYNLDHNLASVAIAEESKSCTHFVGWCHEDIAAACLLCR